MAIPLGSSTQWIRIRGTDVSNPVLLLIQQGPGLPMINEVRRFEKVLGLEKDFTVVYWDQRGCGRSLRGQGSGATITLDLMVSDAVSLLELLRVRFGAKPYVAGFSWVPPSAYRLLRGAQTSWMRWSPWARTSTVSPPATVPTSSC